MTIPAADRTKYGHMPEQLYWEMLEGEDPDDRAIREAHGIGYADLVDGTMCRNGCGLSYAQISAGKIRECEKGERQVTVRGYLVYVPFENVASMEYGNNGAPDKVTVATTPGHLAGPFEVERALQDPAELAVALRSALKAGALRKQEAIGHLMITCNVDPQTAANLMTGEGHAD